MNFFRAVLGFGLLCGMCLAQQPAPDATPTEPTKPKGVIHLQEVKSPPDAQAKENCNNFSFAASLAAVLAYENAEIQQDFWIDKLYAGGLCIEIGDPEELVRKVAGEYTLDDGRHVEIKLEYFPGVPVNSSSFLVPIMTDEILILFVDGHADLLVGAKWDEYLSTRGERMIDLKQLHLVDPLQPEDKRKVVLDVTGDDMKKISGYMSVTATEVHQQYWPK